MKEGHKAAHRAYCVSVLQMIGANVQQDFHTLRSEQIDRLLEEAARAKYRKPANANGSKARYFFARIVRGAR